MKSGGRHKESKAVAVRRQLEQRLELRARLLELEQRLVELEREQLGANYYHTEPDKDMSSASCENVRLSRASAAYKMYVSSGNKDVVLRTRFRNGPVLVNPFGEVESSIECSKPYID